MAEITVAGVKIVSDTPGFAGAVELAKDLQGLGKLVGMTTCPVDGGNLSLAVRTFDNNDYIRVESDGIADGTVYFTRIAKLQSGGYAWGYFGNDKDMAFNSDTNGGLGKWFKDDKENNDYNILVPQDEWFGGK